MKTLWKDKLLLLVIAYLVVVLVAIPLTLTTLRKPQETRTTAAGSASLYFEPAITQKNTGETVAVDIMVNPGIHAVSFLTFDVTYDPNKLTVNQNTAFQINTTAFPTILEGPVYTPGRIRTKVSIGYDPTKALTTVTRAATVIFTASGPTNGQEAVIHFGESSFALSVGPNDGATDNVLNSVTPALMTINGNQIGGGITITPVPTYSAGIGGPPPINTPLPTAVLPTDPVQPTDSVTPTGIPQPTCTPIPPECLIDNTLAVCANVPPGGFCTAGLTPSPTSIAQLPIACQKIEPADIMLIIDKSLGMGGEKIVMAIDSAKSFIKLLKADPTNRVGLVSFSQKADLDSPLTSSTDTVENALNGLALGQSTCIKCGLEEADKELYTNGKPNAQKIMILLTDGRADAGGGPAADKKIAAEQAALNVIKTSKNVNLAVYTIGIGNDVNPGFLQELAAIGKGQYYFVNVTAQFNEQFIVDYQGLSDALCNVAPFPTQIPIITLPPATRTFDPVTIMLVILLFLPLLLLIGHLLI